MQVGRTFGPTNGDQMQGGGGQQGPSNPIADAIRILSLQVPQNPGANSPTGVGLNTPSMMGGQMGSGLLLQWLRSLLGGGGQPGGAMPDGGQPGGGMPGGRFQHALPGAMTPAFNFIHAAGLPGGGGGPMPGNLANDARTRQVPGGPKVPGNLSNDMVNHLLGPNDPMPTPTPGTPETHTANQPANGVNWAQGFNGPNPRPGMEGTFLAGQR